MNIPLIMPQHKPEWFKIRPPSTEKFSLLKNKIRENKLHTVCEESHCPNMSECWSGGTATFMIMGDICTRGCRFCAVKKGKTEALDIDEPRRLAETIREMNEARIDSDDKKLNYIVITSVDRDDLVDQGANHFAECIREIKRLNPKMLVEVLTPDFRGNKELIKKVVEARPDVYAHNIETVRELQKDVRDPRAGYDQSLEVLRFVKEYNEFLNNEVNKSSVIKDNNKECLEKDNGKDNDSKIDKRKDDTRTERHKMLTKSSVMLGLGETEDKVIVAMKDLRKNNVDVVTFGQYLKPKTKYLTVVEYVDPKQFKFYEETASKLGFLYCASGPFVRSSYKAGEFYMESLLRGK